MNRQSEWKCEKKTHNTNRNYEIHEQKMTNIKIMSEKRATHMLQPKKKNVKVVDVYHCE